MLVVYLFIPAHTIRAGASLALAPRIAIAFGAVVIIAVEVGNVIHTIYYNNVM